MLTFDHFTSRRSFLLPRNMIAAAQHDGVFQLWFDDDIVDCHVCGTAFRGIDNLEDHKKTHKHKNKLAGLVCLVCLVCMVCLVCLLCMVYIVWVMWPVYMFTSMFPDLSELRLFQSLSLFPKVCYKRNHLPFSHVK